VSKEEGEQKTKRERKREKREYVCYRKRRSGVGRICDWGRGLE
jgi:hypothetical protein